MWTTTNRLALLFPEQSLTCSIEVSACPAIKVQRTTVRAWADFTMYPWDAMHEGSSWTEMTDGSPANALVEGETFGYGGRGLELELQLIAVGSELRLGDNHSVLPVRVEGFVSFDGERTRVDVEATLEQTWSVESTEGVESEDFEPSAGSLAYGHAGLVLECRTEWDLDGVPAGGEDRSRVDIDVWRSATRPGWSEPADASS